MTATNQATAASPVGLGGWLTVVMLGLFYAVYREGRGVYECYKFLSGRDFYFGSEADKPYLAAELATHLVFALASGVLLVLMFRQSRRFPAVYIACMLVAVVSGATWLALDIALERIPPGLNALTLRRLAGGLLGPAIWIAYMLKSKRVASTFTK